jgi:16S rRNA (adenine1518-N6/adenine1519-N6)-dimethyltransferase
MKQKLGQHFLINPAAIKKIVAALSLEAGDTIIEIGPGRGALTFAILEKCKKINCKIIGIEKDPKLGFRVQGLGDRKNLTIMIGDAIKILPKITKPYTLTPIPYKIVGNIPYYITGKLLRILGELENKPKLIILMLQKEVAERICAQPPRMNLLAAAVQFWAEPKILFTLKPDDFSPPPKVHSAVIVLNPKPSTLNPEPYYKMLHIAFKQPRKTLVNNLGTGIKMPKSELENALKKAGINPQIRPQNLSQNQLELLTTLFLR